MQFNVKGPAKWFLLFGFAVVIVSFVFFFGFSASEGNPSSTVVAKVNNYSISRGEYAIAYQNIQERAREQFKDKANSDEVAEYVKNEALQELVQRHLLLELAKKYNIEPSNQEILNQIASRREFRNEDGKFDSQRFIDIYKNKLRLYEKKRLEEEAESELTLNLLEIRINDAAKLTDNEVRETFDLLNTKVKIGFIYDEGQASQSNALLQLPAVSANRVDKVMEMVKAGRDFATSAQSVGLVPQTTEYFYFGGPILRAGTTNENLSSIQGVLEVYHKAFALRRGQLSDVINTGKGHCMLVLIDRKEPNWANFYKEAINIKIQAQGQKMNSFFQQWFSSSYRDARIESYLYRIFPKSKK